MHPQPLEQPSAAKVAIDEKILMNIPAMPKNTITKITNKITTIASINLIINDFL